MTDCCTAFTVFGLLSIAAFMALRRRCFFYPPLLLLLPFFVSYLMYWIVLRNTTLLMPATNSLLCLSLSTFMVAFLCAEFGLGPVPPLAQDKWSSLLRVLRRVSPLLITLGIVGFALGLATAIRIAQTGQYDVFFNLRFAAIATSAWSGSASVYLMLLCHVGVLGLCVASRPSRGALVLLGTALLIASCFFTMGRSVVLFYLLSVGGAYMLSARYLWQSSFRFGLVLPLLAASLAVMLALGALTGRLFTGQQLFVVTYLANPLVAFDRFVLTSDLVTHGSQTLFPFFRLAEKIGMKHVVPCDLGLTDADFNVFTFMQAPYQDFRAIGVVMGAMALGVFYAVLYRGVREGHPLFILYYAVMLFPLSLAFYDYQFRFLNWIYYAVILAILGVCSRWRACEPSPFREAAAPCS
ncbi:MAG: O-antigen polymerase [bacterium]